MYNGITVLLTETIKERTAILQRAFAVCDHTVNIIEFDEINGLDDFLFGNDKSEQPDNRAYVLFLNLTPVSDGIALLTKIKADEQWQQMPIIVFGPTDENDAVKLCHNLGCSVYLNDPETTDQYTKVVNAIVGFLCIVRIPTIKKY